MKHTKDIIPCLMCLMLILLMSIGTLHVYGQESPESFFQDEENTDVNVREYDAVQNEQVYKNNPPLGVHYTRNHPLVIVGNWRFGPFSFVNDYGGPDGFLVDMLKQMFSSLHVPYTIRMMDWKGAKQMVRDGRAQLMVCIDKNDASQHTGYGKTVLAEYRVGVLHRKEVSKIRSILLLTEQDTLYVMHGDYVDHYLKQYFGDNPPFHIEHIGADEAMVKIYNGTIKYFAWGMLPLRNLVNKYDEGESLSIDDIDIPSGRMRFFSNDSILLHELDLQFQHLKAMQLYEPMCYKWFVNDGKEDEGASAGQITLIVFMVIFIVIFIISYIIIQHNGSTVNLRAEFSTISNAAIDMTRCNVLMIDVDKMWVTNVSGNILPDKGLSMHEYEQLIHPDDIQKEYDIRKYVDDGATDPPVITLRIRIARDKAVEWRLMNVAAVVRQDRKGRPRRIYLVFTDETEHVAEQVKLDTALREFANITDITELGMIYYDADGRFVNCNNTVISIFDQGGLGRARQYLSNSHLQEFPVMLNGITVDKEADMWFCCPIDIQELNLRKFTEIRIQSVYDENGGTMGYEVCLRDIDEYIRIHRDQNTIRKRQLDAKNRLTRLHMELRFILRRNKITTFRWQRGNDYFELSHDLLSFDRHMSFATTIESLILDDKSALLDMQNNPDKYFSVPHDDIYCFRNNHGDGSVSWVHTFIVPDYDKSGNFVGAFGIHCDITDVQRSQESLRRETEKAENSGRQKTIFLSNMTHELRTPLNAVNGFAEIMMYLGSTQEKAEYIDIMRHNCTMLIDLVGNILQLSVMDTDGIKLHRRRVDFAHLFPASVSEMKRYINSPDVKLQLDTPLPTLSLEMDYERVMQVVDAFVNNASKFTEKGFIRVGYRYFNGTLTIYCRDSGCGIPEDKQTAVFERFVKLNDFVQGTGLGLAVCKMIADRMGATLGIYSRVGEGSNLSFNLPCS